MSSVPLILWAVFWVSITFLILGQLFKGTHPKGIDPNYRSTAEQYFIRFMDFGFSLSPDGDIMPEIQPPNRRRNAVWKARDQEITDRNTEALQSYLVKRSILGVSADRWPVLFTEGGYLPWQRRGFPTVAQVLAKGSPTEPHGRAGGLARAAALTADQRRDIARKAAQARWLKEMSGKYAGERLI
jgi:hypothetical protein